MTECKHETSKYSKLEYLSSSSEGGGSWVRITDNPQSSLSPSGGGAKRQDSEASIQPIIDEVYAGVRGGRVTQKGERASSIASSSKQLGDNDAERTKMILELAM